MQDPVLKRIFAVPAMIELLARRYRADLASEIDFSTLGKLPNELVSNISYGLVTEASTSGNTPKDTAATSGWGCSGRVG